jgi:beta-lactamase superfamily II metal-dependent hydrolase
MARPKTSKTSLTETTDSSLTLSVQIHVFACGHGDTILVCLQEKYWILIDCRLTKQDGFRDQFFEFLDEHKINRLDYIVLTHPDIDHFFGMVDVLNYFTESGSGRSLGAWCYSGESAQDVKTFLTPDSESEYRKLIQRIAELSRENKIRPHRIDENSRAVIVGPESLKDQVELIPIAPDPAILHQLFGQGVSKLAKKSVNHLEANPLSIVLVLSIRQGKKSFHFLFGGDAEADGIRQALEIWRDRANEKSAPPQFDGIKIPHHGSIHSHFPDLCKFGSTSTSEKIAIVSAGTRSKLPERTVLNDYLSNDWKVLITTKRKRNRRKRVLTLAGKDPPTFSVSSHNILIQWTSTAGLTWEPVGSQITSSDLRHYDRYDGK